MSKHYDIIGDIHGHADELKALLETMDYALVDGCYRHPTKTVVFLGDFIDRGPQQRDVLQTVMPMVAQGAALAVMGNHEFNALAYHTRHSPTAHTWLRPRSNRNTQQHLAFLQEYLDPKREDELETVLRFFHSLPLWLELDGFRAVHACWAPQHIKVLQPRLNSDNSLTPELLVEANDGRSAAFAAVEALLKGVEYALPGDSFFLDKDGHKRRAVRTRWWLNSDSTLGDLAFASGLDVKTAAIPISADEVVGYRDEKPVFLGHYWLKGHPAKLTDKVACLDYSVAKGGKLVAYRWQGERILNDEHFIFV